MPRPKIYDTPTDQKRAWMENNTDRIGLNVRKDAPINKAVFQKAAAALGVSLSEFLVMAGERLIADKLGSAWLAENENKGGADDGDKEA